MSDFSTLYIKNMLKAQLDSLKCHGDTYQSVIQRLIDRRNFDVIDGQIVTNDTKV